MGYYSTGGPASGAAQTSEVECAPGSWCAGGVSALCPAGVYGDAPGASTPACAGACSDGYVCGAGSTAPDAVLCPAGFYCSGGAPHGCPPGTYNEAPGASSVASCVPCGAGTYSGAPNASLAGDCAPCVPPEGSASGAAACWPGLLSAVASNPPPITPGLSPGDIVTLTFSKTTNTPPVGSDGALGALLSFSAYVGAGLRGIWSPDGRVLIVTMGDTSGTDAAASRIGAITVSIVLGGPLRDAGGASQAPALPPEPLSGNWGVATVPQFLASGGVWLPAYATNGGGQAGCGVGDTLVLRFDGACKQLPLGRTSDVDALLAFSSPIGGAYTGVWDTAGPFKFAGLTIKITSPLPGGVNATATAVGALRVSVRPSAGLTSLDESTAASNASVLVSSGSWGDAPGLSIAPASHVRARLRVDHSAARGVAAVRVACSGTRPPYNATLPAAGDGGALVTYVPGFAPLATAACTVVLVSVFSAGVGAVTIVGTNVTGAVQLALPVLLSVSADVGALSTAGGDVVFLTGAYLGYAGSPAVVTARYWSPVDGWAFRLVVCATVASPGGGGSAVVQCASAPGAGTGFMWAVSLDGGESAPAAAPLAYNRPIILDVATAAGGGGGVVIAGRDLGPVGTRYLGRVWLTLSSDPNVTFTAARCNVTVADSEVVCDMPEGCGGNLYWTLAVGGQLSALPTSSYAPPRVANISCAPSPCSALSTLPGVDTIYLSGSGLGTSRDDSGAVAFVDGSRGGVLLLAGGAAGGGNVRLTGCRVVAAGTLVACASPGGVGAGFSVRARCVLVGSPVTCLMVSCASSQKQMVLLFLYLVSVCILCISF